MEMTIIEHGEDNGESTYKVHVFRGSESSVKARSSIRFVDLVHAAIRNLGIEADSDDIWIEGDSDGISKQIGEWKYRDSTQSYTIRLIQKPVVTFEDVQ